MKWTATLAVAAALMYIDAVQSACDDDWHEFGGPGICFYFLEVKADWYTARSLCQALGGDLATVSGTTHQEVIAYINDEGEGILDDEVFWIGGSDLEHSGSWTWLNGIDIPLGPPHWYPCNGQPNNPDTQHHLCLYTPDFYYHSLEYTYNYFAICQKPPPTVAAAN